MTEVKMYWSIHWLLNIVFCFVCAIITKSCVTIRSIISLHFHVQFKIAVFFYLNFLFFIFIFISFFVFILSFFVNSYAKWIDTYTFDYNVQTVLLWWWRRRRKRVQFIRNDERTDERSVSANCEEQRNCLVSFYVPHKSHMSNHLKFVYILLCVCVYAK